MLYPVVGVSASTPEGRHVSLVVPELRGLLDASRQWPQGTESWRSENKYCRCCVFPAPVAVGEYSLPHYLRFPAAV